MPFDFNPDLTPEEKDVKIPKDKKTKDAIITQEAALVNQNRSTSDVVTIQNLLGLTQSHIQDDNECRNVVNILTEELNNSIQIMSVREMLEYIKVKLREREFHVDCIFKAYTFIQRSEYAREMFMGSNRKERIIEATDRKNLNAVLSMLSD